MKKNKGFILVSVLFLVVVLGAIALVMSSTTGVQQLTNVYSIEASRAYFAARSGLEYAIDRATSASACTNGTVALAGINFTIDVSCASTVGIDEAGNLSTVYTITSTASTGSLGSLNFVTRTVRTTIN